MSEYTLPPTITGVPPETWEQILQILNQFGITVWDLTQQGITTWEGAGGLKEYLLNNGWELKEVWDLKEMWFYTGAGDATQSNALVQYVANEVTIAGTAGSEYVKHFTYGDSTLGKVKKGIVFGVVFALLISSLDPTLITDTLKSRLESVIDLFADENDDVPVIVGADGKTYYHEDMIDALRDVLIDEGAYSTGGITPPASLNTNIPYTYQTSSTGSGTLRYADYNRCEPFLRQFAPVRSATNPHRIGIAPGDAASPIYELTSNMCYGIYYATQSSQRATYSYIIDADKIPLFNDVTVNTNVLIQWVDMDTGAFYGSGSLKKNKFTFTYNNVEKTVYVISGSISGNYSDMQNAFGEGASNLADASQSDLSSMFAYLFGEQSPTIEGITVDDNLITAGIGDNTVSLATVFPEFAEDYITTINPTDEDLGAHDNWYPISTYNNDVWEDGITEQQSETAPDGEVSPDMQTAIADAIKQILEDYYRDPTDPTIINWPQIPVSDSGDTPPENPELISGSSNGLWAIYNPTISEVQQFGAWLWSSNILDQITRMFNSPIDAVIGFHMIYCTPVTGSNKTIKAGYLDSPVSAKEVTNQYVDIDCGTVTISEYYRNALDYDNTRISLFLPFIGIVPLDTNTVMGSQLSILYRVDVLTGTCLAQVKVIKENSEAVLYTFQGNCSVQVPLTATTYTGMVGALLSGISAGASIMTGNIVGAVSAGLEGAMRAGTGLSGVRQSGTIGANAGALGIRIPYVIITHPVSAMSDGFNTLEGLPSNALVNLSSVSGFTRVTFVHLENIPATMPEIEEIQTLLETGVIF